MRRCTDPACDTMHFPRTDPAVIMLVTDGERALMGRNKNFVPGMYSTLAGFVEPGESLEDAVAREVREETAIEVGAVHYHSSQPWPFPANIMLGFYAEATTTEITVDYGELEDARWFERDWLLSHVDDDSSVCRAATRSRGGWSRIGFTATSNPAGNSRPGAYSLAGPHRFEVGRGEHVTGVAELAGHFGYLFPAHVLDIVAREGVQNVDDALARAAAARLQRMRVIDAHALVVEQAKEQAARRQLGIDQLAPGSLSSSAPSRAASHPRHRRRLRCSRLRAARAAASARRRASRHSPERPTDNLMPAWICSDWRK